MATDAGGLQTVASGCAVPGVHNALTTQPRLDASIVRLLMNYNCMFRFFSRGGEVV